MDLREEFKDVIEIDRQYITLYFTLVHVPKMQKYFVVAKPTVGEITSFEMKADKGKNWKVLSPAPKWVTEQEDELIRIVTDNNS